ncbi:MAG: hypothetical protein JWR51_444 [Devosia sp.]|uniref:hypothetical protein n=1 Tax=Devosia sp. TaxID=1871048 RepID=UPI00263A31A3|nr:hypothetical protein [Devosia sp.]MDB5527341.1 hypothetical protein [Devosia sp.]
MSFKLNANMVLSAPGALVSARLSFIAIDNARRLFGICPKFVARAIKGAGAFSCGGATFNSNGPTLVARGPSLQASSLIGYFGLAPRQEIDLKIPRRTSSPFDVLGTPVFVHGAPRNSTLVLDRIGVSVPAPDAGDLIEGFLELQSEDASIPTNGTLLVDGDGRGVCILVGRVGASYLAVGLEDCLVALGLGPIAHPEQIMDFGEEIGADDEVHHSLIAKSAESANAAPSGQLLDILSEFEVGATYG